MFTKSDSLARVTEMGCCGCFGLSFSRKPKRSGRPNRGLVNNVSQEFLLVEEDEDEEEEDGLENGGLTDTGNRDDGEYQSPVKRSEEILKYRIQNGLICREIPVKETNRLVRSEVSASLYSLVIVVLLVNTRNFPEAKCFNVLCCDCCSCREY